MALKKKITDKILELDNNAFGDLKITKSQETYFVSGELYTTIKDPESVIHDVFAVELPKAVVYVTLAKSAKGLSVTLADDDTGEHETDWSACTPSVLDEVSTLFYGELPLTALRSNPKHKLLNFETVEKVKSIVEVLGVIQPIIVDRNMEVIDGNLRLHVAKVLEHKTVPVFVLDCEGDKTAFLRLVLNRSSEFQRWNYDDVDAFVDSILQVQPLLEPLGFFSNNILPTTFFGNTIIGYKLDEYNNQMKMYSQDIGLAEWAKVMRERRLAEEEEKKKKAKFKPSSSGAVSIFDLVPTEKDIIKTHDTGAVISAHVEEMKEVAGVITDNYDKVRKAEIEAKGKEWQTSRRTSKALAADKRREAELIDGITEGVD
jgi:hypothetical protein